MPPVFLQRDIEEWDDARQSRYAGSASIAFERMGFVIASPIRDLFVAMTAPLGWELRPTHHSMSSDVVDARGRVRAHSIRLHFTIRVPT
ncbi:MULTISPECIES: hypothetical protein [unclassified Ensifer]|uniref:hypothetical protein n=1 Tax=unclassified Ensifer TaxID=2633371 RepID=UPI000715CD9F|nr:MULTISPECIES: hypothetical protein [unclassified Ensifer]KQX58447.1 hypothetical protein ASD49_20455 [Ensifer sp. Root1298]KQX88488.1 hypothetical protein ASD41_27575 [Ensifer sp. Root1312]KRC22099.1 hypothetical protein ASE29_28250 [Ensifer sp. Root74]KRD74258.1 hypothetical protein ASE71_18415 [Ensifer sp. Root954]